MTASQYYWYIRRPALLRQYAAGGASSQDPVPPTPVYNKLHPVFSLADASGAFVCALKQNEGTSTPEVVVFDAFPSGNYKMKFVYATETWTLEDLGGTVLGTASGAKGALELTLSNGYKTYAWTYGGKWTMEWKSDLVGSVSRSRAVLPFDQNYMFVWYTSPDPDEKIPQVVHIMTAGGDFVNDVWNVTFEDDEGEEHTATTMSQVGGVYVPVTTRPNLTQAEFRLKATEESDPLHARNGELIAVASWSDDN